MGNGKKYPVLLIFTIIFFLIAAFFTYTGYSLLYGASPIGESVGETFGLIFGAAIVGTLMWGIAIIAGLIFLIMLIIYIILRVKSK